MSKTFLTTFIAFLLFTTISAQSKDDLLIRNALTEQLNAWNTGDIDRFMTTYWQSDSLKFIGKSGVTYGWQKTLDNYKRNYPDTAAMGKLDFKLIEVKRLSLLYYSVVGKWHLSRSIGDIQGYFTLLLKKIKNRWVM
jgi:hypothetical protein